jgi:hypothetical protein
MEGLRMWKISIIGFCLFIGCFLVGCGGGSGDGDGDGGGSSGNLSGHWAGTGTYHTDDDGDPISMPFTMSINITHSGTLIQGTYLVNRPVRGDMPGTISGTFDGTNIDMTFNPHGRAWGTVSGGVMTLDWLEDFGGGVGPTATISLGKE